MSPNHSSQGTPAHWVQLHAHLIPKTGQVLDLACGGGRHSRYLLQTGHRVLAADKEVHGLTDIEENPNLDIVEVDLENGQPFPFRDRQFTGIVVINYLYRPLFNDLKAVLAKNGVLIYQSFMLGNEAYGRPRNPDFLLKENELKEVFGGSMDVIDFEQGLIERPTPAVVQKICAKKR